MKHMNWKSPLLLFLAATIWGVAFVAQSVGMDYVGPFTFNATRSVLGGAVLLLYLVIADRKKAETKQEAEAMQNVETMQNVEAKHKKSRQNKVDLTWSNPLLLTGGICCGVCLCIASNLQQVGILYTSVGKSGFITAMYIVLVPVFGLFLKKRLGWNVWISILMGVAGLYLLCMNESFSLQSGDIYLLLCAVCFSLHILIVDHFVPYVDGVKMSCIQFWVCGILSGIVMLLFETPSVGAVIQAWLPIAYAGIMSCGVAYTLQIVGQKDMNPTIASLILSLESVVSVIAGWIILGQKLTVRELGGCVIMFAAIILAQLPMAEGKDHS